MLRRKPVCLLGTNVIQTLYFEPTSKLNRQQIYIILQWLYVCIPEKSFSVVVAWLPKHSSRSFLKNISQEFQLKLCSGQITETTVESIVKSGQLWHQITIAQWALQSVQCRHLSKLPKITLQQPHVRLNIEIHILDTVWPYKFKMPNKSLYSGWKSSASKSLTYIMSCPGGCAVLHIKLLLAFNQQTTGMQSYWAILQPQQINSPLSPSFVGVTEQSNMCH